MTTLALPGGWSLQFTGTRVRYPNGRRFQNIGIVPDILVEPTLRGLTAGKDEVLEKGVEVLLSRIQASH
jgi:carboxyl-terminal processing protease